MENEDEIGKMAISMGKMDDKMEPDMVDTSVIIRILTHAQNRTPLLREELGAEMTAWSAAQQQSAILILDCSH